MNKMAKSLLWLLVDILFIAGWGITLHAVANELYHKGGYAEILSLQGEYIGFALMMAAYIIIRIKFRRAEKLAKRT
jgi:uncharacterized membrane protein